MIGLLKKDLFVADKSGRLLMVLALGFSLIPPLGAFGSTYAMMLALMMPITTLAYDERSKWDRYAAMLPYSPEQIVWSKYLLAYIFTLLAGGIIVLGALLRGVSTGDVDWMETAEMSVMLGVAMLFVTALGLPALYRFGTEKGRYMMLLVMGVGVGAVLGLQSIFGEAPQLPRLPLAAVIAGVAVLAVLATYVSFRVSVRVYKKRQSGAYNA